MAILNSYLNPWRLVVMNTIFNALVIPELDESFSQIDEETATMLSEMYSIPADAYMEECALNHPPRNDV